MITLEQARAWYPVDDPVHGFEHVLRVLAMAERLAMAEGADVEIVRAAVLLHDADGRLAEGDGQAVGSEQWTEERKSHHLNSAEFAGQVLGADGWEAERIEKVQHCIRAHRFRDDSEQPGSLEAQVLFDADKLDAIGAIGVARAIGYALGAGQPFYAAPSQAFLETGQTEPGERHSAYHEHLFKLRKLAGRLYTPAARRIAAGRHQAMEDYFARLADEMEGREEIGKGENRIGTDIS